MLRPLSVFITQFASHLAVCCEFVDCASFTLPHTLLSSLIAYHIEGTAHRQAYLQMAAQLPCSNLLTTPQTVSVIRRVMHSPRASPNGHGANTQHSCPTCLLYNTTEAVSKCACRNKSRMLPLSHYMDTHSSLISSSCTQALTAAAAQVTMPSLLDTITALHTLSTAGWTT